MRKASVSRIRPAAVRHHRGTAARAGRRTGPARSAFTPAVGVRRYRRTAPGLSGITETVGWCRRNGLVPVLATLAWSPVGSYLTDRFGFHAFCGPRLETDGNRFTGRVARHFDEYDKRDFALAQARELGLAPGSCGAVGDSRSDLPLFASVGLSVAFDASAGARVAATVTVDGGDLRGVLPTLSRLVTTR
ncbi:HAD family hydrolase [Streptomyces sp. NPDC091287]|uniref:HAD family hydrolase n=1 Tax=Streptomyces sp. NPDC091287 TaxID=3365988 RepID=UPI00382A0462